MSASFRCDGRVFHSPGPAAPTALSPKVLYVRVTTHVRLAVERSRLTRRQDYLPIVILSSQIQAVVLLKTTFLPTPHVFDLEFEGHAVGIWRRKLVSENKNHETAMW